MVHTYINLDNVLVTAFILIAIFQFSVVSLLRYGKKNPRGKWFNLIAYISGIELGLLIVYTVGNMLKGALCINSPMGAANILTLTYYSILSVIRIYYAIKNKFDSKWFYLIDLLIFAYLLAYTFLG